MGKCITFKKQNYLHHQWEWLTSLKEEAALVTGFGGGKTHIFLRKALWAHINLKNKRGLSNGWVIYPTYALAEELFIEEFKLLLYVNKIKYKYNISKHVFITKYGRIRVFQLQRPELMVGSELTFCGFDEFDVEKKDKVLHAYDKAIGRMRGCEHPQLFVVTTPEGYRATHHIFVEEYNDNKLLIQGSTRDNPYREKGYISRMERTYTPTLVKAYVDGQFVNLTSGSVYPYFDKIKSHTNEVHKPEEKLFIGQDFNFGGCCSSVFVERGGNFYQVFEYVSRDTEQIVQNTKKHFPDNMVEFYPDATGNSNSTNASMTDINMLKNAGYTVKAKKTNPRIQDRVNSVNSALYNGTYKINTKTCPESTKAIEQQSYDVKTGQPEKSSAPASPDDWNDSKGYPIALKYPIRRVGGGTRNTRGI